MDLPPRQFTSIAPITPRTTADGCLDAPFAIVFNSLICSSARARAQVSATSSRSETMSRNIYRSANSMRRGHPSCVILLLMIVERRTSAALRNTRNFGGLSSPTMSHKAGWIALLRLEVIRTCRYSNRRRDYSDGTNILLSVSVFKRSRY